MKVKIISNNLDPVQTQIYFTDENGLEMKLDRVQEIRLRLTAGRNKGTMFLEILPEELLIINGEIPTKRIEF
jgi:hypothetical protein